MSDGAMTEAELSTATAPPPSWSAASSPSGSCPAGTGSARSCLATSTVPQAFERSGIPLEAIGAAVASGHLSFGFVDQMFVGHAPLTGRTFREIADDLGLPLETLTRLYAMWGLPRPDPGDVVRADDAPTFSEWKAFFPPEALNEQLLTQGARPFGEATSRLADWGMALYQAYVAAPMLAAGMSAQEVIDASSTFSQVGMPMMARQLSWLLRRKIEHNTFQLIVEHVESSVEAAGAAGGAGGHRLGTGHPPGRRLLRPGREPGRPGHGPGPAQAGPGHPGGRGRHTGRAGPLPRPGAGRAQGHRRRRGAVGRRPAGRLGMSAAKGEPPCSIGPSR
jgi:Adenylate cyclase regulatory domain